MIAPLLILASATFYSGAGQQAANGHSLAANVRRYGRVCAYNQARLGSRLLVSRHSDGRTYRAVYVVVDKISHGSDLDIFGSRAFCVIAGAGGAVKGRVEVSVRVLGRGKRNKK